MKTTLNLPDPLVERAKRFALSRRTTLTQLLVDGLKRRLDGELTPVLPVSTTTGGLLPGLDWAHLERLETQGGWHR